MWQTWGMFTSRFQQTGVGLCHYLWLHKVRLLRMSKMTADKGIYRKEGHHKR